MHRSRSLIFGVYRRAFWLVVAQCISVQYALAAGPANMLPKRYKAGIEVSEYLVSEKLDGVRARWDGKRLISRGGKVLAAPTWFTEQFPSTPMDGELWSKRNDYQKVASITAKHQPHSGWRALRLMVFDLPTNVEPFSQRYLQLQHLVGQNKSSFLGLIIQRQLPDEASLLRLLNEVVLAGGEGLILHHKASLYRAGRSNQLLKLKQFHDAEATVLGYRNGKGKYQGMTGALLVKTSEGLQFYVGSGLSDVERRHPPSTGSVIRYQYSGFTDSGLPRFPVYLGPRPEFDR